MRRDSSKVYTEINTEPVKHASVASEYKKSCQRMQSKPNDGKPTSSPRSEKATMVSISKRWVLPHIRRTLLLQDAVVAEIKNKYREGRHLKSKFVLARILRGNILKKYRMTEKTRRAITTNGI